MTQTSHFIFTILISFITLSDLSSMEVKVLCVYILYNFSNIEWISGPPDNIGCLRLWHRQVITLNDFIPYVIINPSRPYPIVLIALDIKKLHVGQHEFQSLVCIIIFMPPPLGAGGIMFSGCPSVRPKAKIPSFDLYMGPLVHPTNRYRFTACPSVRPSVCPSVRPERFPGIYRRMHGGISLKFCMLMYLDHPQNWLVYGHGLLIFLILALFWLSETGQIWGFRAFTGECMEGMAWNFARWCILTTFRTD